VHSLVIPLKDISASAGVGSRTAAAADSDRALSLFSPIIIIIRTVVVVVVSSSHHKSHSQQHAAAAAVATFIQMQQLMRSTMYSRRLTTPSGLTN